MVNTGMGQRPTVIYGMVSGTGTSSANLKISHSDGDWIPLQSTADGKLMVDTELILSGTTFELNNIKVGSTNQIEANKYLSTDSEGVLRNHSVISGSVLPAIRLDTTGAVELGEQTLAAIEHITAVISGTVVVELDHESDDVLIYGNDRTTDDFFSDRKIRTDMDGALIAVISGTVVSQISEKDDSIQIFGQDLFDVNREILTTSSGVLIVNISGTTTVSTKYSDSSIQVYGSDGINQIAVKTDTSGGVELGTTTLTALENITAVISGTIVVELDHESDDVLIYGNNGIADQKIKTDTDGALIVVVSGTILPSVKLDSTGAIELGSDSLAALENVVTVMSGTMVVDSVLNDVGIKLPSTPNTYNVAITNSATEYNQALPSNTKKFITQNRAAFVRTNLSFSAGASNTTFITIPEGSSYYEDGVNTDKTLYFQTPAASGTVFEIVAWV